MRAWATNAKNTFNLVCPTWPTRVIITFDCSYHQICGVHSVRLDSLDLIKRTAGEVSHGAHSHRLQLRCKESHCLLLFSGGERGKNFISGKHEAFPRPRKKKAKHAEFIISVGSGTNLIFADDCSGSSPLLQAFGDDVNRARRLIHREAIGYPAHLLSFRLR